MKALVVDDQRSARHILVQLLSRIDNVTLVQAASLQEALVHIRVEPIEVAFIDLRLGDDIRNRDGLVLIETICKTTSITPIVVSGHTDVNDLRAAFRLGAHDYLVKDSLCEELLRPLLEGVQTRRRLQAEVTDLRARSTGTSTPTNLVGSSKVMQDLRAQIGRVAASDRSVLVKGPTGSGKELVVQAIHALSTGSRSPLLDLNCSALPANLLESQLFGHEKGAFTGADSNHLGYLSVVGEGTLFLDEIAELEANLQAKLLRVLEARTFRAVGSTREETFRGRVIAATHIDLAAAVRAGRFREDLFYRLDVLTVQVPSLEERREDIPALVAHFAAKQSRRLTFEDEAIRLLQSAAWPGNVRQLRNVIDRLAVMVETERIRADDIRVAFEPSMNATDSVRHLAAAVLAAPGGGNKIELVASTLVEEALRIAQANKSAAARILGVHRKVIERWARRERDESDDGPAAF
jgi:DNA-binding NtrC family response regulator